MTRTPPAVAIALALAACTPVPLDPIADLQRQAWAEPWEL